MILCRLLAYLTVLLSSSYAYALHHIGVLNTSREGCCSLTVPSLLSGRPNLFCMDRHAVDTLSSIVILTLCIWQPLFTILVTLHDLCHAAAHADLLLCHVLLKAPDADSKFRYVLLDEGGVTNKSGARLFTSRAALVAELKAQGEPLNGLKFALEDGCDGAAGEDDSRRGKAYEPPPRAAVVM